jgi:hypothetical protein
MTNQQRQLKIEFEDGHVVDVAEYAVLPSGRIVAMVERDGPESYWFEPDGKNPKSRLLGRSNAMPDQRQPSEAAQERALDVKRAIESQRRDGAYYSEDIEVLDMLCAAYAIDRPREVTELLERLRGWLGLFPDEWEDEPLIDWARRVKRWHARGYEFLGIESQPDSGQAALGAND